MIFFAISAPKPFKPINKIFAARNLQYHLILCINFETYKLHIFI